MNSPQDTKLISTQDGSYTLYNNTIDEQYHSVYGAIQESRHVFIKNGLQRVGHSKPSILEIGFGTGLNCYLTYLEAQKHNMSLLYHAMELYPLDYSIVLSLNYPLLLEDTTDIFFWLHQAKWDTTQKPRSFFTLTKFKADITKTIPPQYYDCIYFDSFSPDKQPEVWSENVFSTLFSHLNHHGILVTYCTKGIIKRRLQKIGFTIETSEGPPGKREILIAYKMQENV